MKKFKNLCFVLIVTILFCSIFSSTATANEIVYTEKGKAEFSKSKFFQPLSKKDIILESIFVGITCIDWMQTKKFVADKEDKLTEKNPILGKEPTQERIDTLIFSAIVSHIFITYALPEKYREPWQMVLIIIEAWSVNVNHNKGVRISIGF